MYICIVAFSRSRRGCFGSSTDDIDSRPERGSFPLDHDAECKYLISSYLRCLKKPRPAHENGKVQAGINDQECRLIAKDYLQCRMDNNLMAKDEMKNLGLEFSTQSDGKNSRHAENTDRPQPNP
jgi:cytochrome c oxidase assembly protein subunit 19